MGINEEEIQRAGAPSGLNVGLAATRFGIPEKCDYDPYMSGCGYIVQPPGIKKCPQADACIKCAEIFTANIPINRQADLGRPNVEEKP